MQPTDQPTETMFCSHDNTAVDGDAPRCLHPSSWCDFRQLCPVIDAERARKRRLQEAEAGNKRNRKAD